MRNNIVGVLQEAIIRPMLFLRRSRLKLKHDFYKYLQWHFLSTISSSSTHHNNLQTLIKIGSTPALQSINNLLLFLLQSRKFHFIIHFFSQLTSNHHLHFKPTSRTLSIVTWALLKLHKFEEAHLFVTTHMTKASFLPETRLLDCLVQGLEPEKALLVLKVCLGNCNV